MNRGVGLTSTSALIWDRVEPVPTKRFTVKGVLP